MTNPPTPPYTEATGPKPSTSDPVPEDVAERAYAAARAAISRRGSQLGDAIIDAVRVAYAAGRAQAAADIRTEMGLCPVVMPLTPDLAAELVEYCAQLADPATECDG